MRNLPSLKGSQGSGEVSTSQVATAVEGCATSAVRGSAVHSRHCLVLAQLDVKENADIEFLHRWLCSRMHW